MSHLASTLATELMLEEERWRQNWAAQHSRRPHEHPRPKPTLDSQLTKTPRLPSIAEQKRKNRGLPSIADQQGRKVLPLARRQQHQQQRKQQQPFLPVLPGQFQAEGVLSVEAPPPALRHSGRPREDSLDVRIDLQPDEIPTAPASALRTLNEKLLSQPLEEKSRGSGKVVYAREREEPNVTAWGKQLVLPKWDEFFQAPRPPKGRERRNESVASPSVSSRSSVLRSKLATVIWNGPDYARPLTLGMPPPEEMGATRAEKMILPQLNMAPRGSY